MRIIASDLLPDNKILPGLTKKNLLVLHNTAGGTWGGAYQSFLLRNDRVATAYIVDRNGDIAQMFDPARSAYHLGLRDTQANDLRSIAIEIVNWGPLVARDGEFWAWPGNFAQTKVPKDSVFDNRLQYRGHRFWHSYTPEQIEAVAELTKQLLSQFEIPNTLHATLEFQPASWRNSFQGIASHHNFRADKFDTGPAFPFTNFQKLISTP